MFDDIEIEGKAIGDRLAFNDGFKRSDIADFAFTARDIVMGRRRIDPELLSKTNQSLAQIRLQIEVEARFPAGVRIGTFVHSPICVISALAHGEPCPVPTTSIDILAWLRRKTGWELDADELTERAIGIRLPILARELEKLHVKDPVSFYLLMSFEFGQSGLDVEVAYPSSQRLQGERHWPFHGKMRLIDVMKQLAEWCRAINIADYLFQGEAAHHLALRDYAEGRVTLHKTSPHIRSIVESMPLPVPMLKAILDNHKPFTVQNMMAEFERVVMPSVQHGNGTKRPLYHFYGLGAVDVLMVAFLDILCVNRGVSAHSSALNGPHVRRPHFEHFGQDRLMEILEATLINRWPRQDMTMKQDAALRAKILRRRYARASVVLGSAFRFDPEFWSLPERDARLFQRLTTMANTKPNSGAFPYRVAQIKDRLLAALSIKVDKGHIKLGSRIVAHLMTATTVSTRDPVLLSLLDHAMWQGGYRSNRNTCRQHVCRKHGKCLCVAKPYAELYRNAPIHAARNWGCVLPVRALGSRKFPELPRKGECKS